MRLIVWAFFCCAVKALVMEQPSELTESSIDGPTNKSQHFTFFPNRVPWGEAQATCLKQGGHLATVHSEEEDKHVRELTAGQQAWIGLSDCQLEGQWFWIDSNPLNYSHWCTGEPNNGGYGHFGFENCAVTDDQCWEDTSCTNHRSFVCEVKTP